MADTDALEPDTAAARAAQRRRGLVRPREADDTSPFDGEEEVLRHASDGRAQADHGEAWDGAALDREEVHGEAWGPEDRGAEGHEPATGLFVADDASPRNVATEELEPQEAQLIPKRGARRSGGVLLC